MSPAPWSQARSDDFSDPNSENDESSGSNTEDGGVRRMSKEDDRHGKFVDLRNFMNITTELARTLRHESPGILQAKPGWIVHVQDNEDKVIDGRVLLVLQNSTQSDLCLSFCLHNPIRYEDHWRVYKVGDAPKKNQAEDLSALEVHLRPFPHTNESFAPKQDITLNLRDHWNIETSVSRTVKAAYIGRVQTASLQRLSLEVKRIFCHHQDKAIPQPRTHKTKRVVGASEIQGKRRKRTAHG